MIGVLSWRSARAAWNQFFLLPRDTFPCDIVRVGFGLLVLVVCITSWPNVILWWGQSGTMPYDVSRELIGPYVWTVFDLLPRSDTTAQICIAILAAQAALLVMGVWCRFQAICIYILLMSFHYRNLMIIDSQDTVFRLIGFLLIFMPLGYHLSWRNVLHQKSLRSVDSPKLPCWALRLLQIEMCLIFFSAAFSKMNSKDWLDGTIMYYTSRLDDYFGRFPTPSFLWESMWIMALMGWSVIALEALVPIFVWFKETRRLALILAALFHLACDYSMNLYMFHWIMLVGWCSFLTGFDGKQPDLKHAPTDNFPETSVLSIASDST